MKLSKFIKLTPFLTTIILIIFFSINNQKEYTKLKILLWNTPMLPLGTYIAISSGSGFLISYLITSSFSNFNKSSLKNVINYKFENQENYINEKDISSTPLEYENTLIERDVNDPSPTINANFRVIGKRTNKNEFYNNKAQRNYLSNDFPEESVDYQYDKTKNYDTNNQNKTFSNDWLDNSYLDW